MCCEITVSVVHRFELAAVHRNHGPAEQAHATAQHHKLGADRADRGSVIAPEVGDGLEVRCQPISQPHQLDIATCFPFKPAA